MHKDGISNKLIIWYDTHNKNKDRLNASIVCAYKLKLFVTRFFIIHIFLIIFIFFIVRTIFVVIPI